MKDLVGHRGSVLCCCVYKDTVVTAGYDKTIKIWCCTTGDLRKTIDAHNHIINGLDIYYGPSAPNSIVSGSWDKELKMWNLKNGKLLHTFSGHRNRIKCVKCLSDHDFSISAVASSGDDDGFIFIWDLTNKSKLFNLNGHSHFVRNIDMCRLPTAKNNSGYHLPSGSQYFLVSYSSDGSIRLWDVENGETVSILESSCPDITSLAFAKIESENKIKPSLEINSSLLSPTKSAFLPPLSPLNLEIRDRNSIFSEESVQRIDSFYVTVASDKDGNIRIFNLKTGKLVYKIELNRKIVSICIVDKIDQNLWNLSEISVLDETFADTAVRKNANKQNIDCNYQDGNHLKQCGDFLVYLTEDGGLGYFRLTVTLEQTIMTHSFILLSSLKTFLTPVALDKNTELKSLSKNSFHSKRNRRSTGNLSDNLSTCISQSSIRRMKETVTTSLFCRISISNESTSFLLNQRKAELSHGLSLEKGKELQQEQRFLVISGEDGKISCIPFVVAHTTRERKMLLLNSFSRPSSALHIMSINGNSSPGKGQKSPSKLTLLSPLLKFEGLKHQQSIDYLPTLKDHKEDLIYGDGLTSPNKLSKTVVESDDKRELLERELDEMSLGSIEIKELKDKFSWDKLDESKYCIKKTKLNSIPFKSQAGLTKHRIGTPAVSYDSLRHKQNAYKSVVKIHDENTVPYYEVSLVKEYPKRRIKTRNNYHEDIQQLRYGSNNNSNNCKRTIRSTDGDRNRVDKSYITTQTIMNSIRKESKNSNFKTSTSCATFYDFVNK